MPERLRGFATMATSKNIPVVKSKRPESRKLVIVKVPEGRGVSPEVKLEVEGVEGLHVFEVIQVLHADTRTALVTTRHAEVPQVTGTQRLFFSLGSGAGEILFL